MGSRWFGSCYVVTEMLPDNCDQSMLSNFCGQIDTSGTIAINRGPVQSTTTCFVSAFCARLNHISPITNSAPRLLQAQGDATTDSERKHRRGNGNCRWLLFFDQNRATRRMTTCIAVVKRGIDVVKRGLFRGCFPYHPMIMTHHGDDDDGKFGSESCCD